VSPTAPAQISLAPGTVSPTNAGTVTFTLTFNEAVVGVTAGAFSVGGTCSGGSIGTLAGSGSGPYTVGVTGTAGSAGCTISTLMDKSGITDVAGNALGAGTLASVDITFGTHLLDLTLHLTTLFAGVISTDTTAPTSPAGVTVQSPASSPTNAASLVFTVSFDEPVLGLQLSSFRLAGSTCTGTTLGSLTGSGGTAGPFTVTAMGMQSSAGCTVKVSLNSTGVADMAGNSLGSVGFATITYGTGLAFLD
jgi:hypothetical protein